MKKFAFLLALAASCLGYAQDPCSEELLRSYFPAQYVENTLKEYQIPESKWPAIVSGLAEQDVLVVRTVESKAEKMDPNPLRSPQNREVAVTLFRETLYELFSQVLAQQGIDDPELTAKMLDHVQYQKAKRFIDCMNELKGKESEE